MKTKRFCSFLLTGITALAMATTLVSCGGGGGGGKSDKTENLNDAVADKKLTIEDRNDGDLYKYAFFFGKGGAVTMHCVCAEDNDTGYYTGKGAIYDGTYTVATTSTDVDIKCKMTLTSVYSDNHDDFVKDSATEMRFRSTDGKLVLTKMVNDYGDEGTEDLDPAYISTVWE